MCSGITNLSRKVLPTVSAVSSKNKQSVNAMPEMVLARLKREGANNIVYCDMNQSVAAIISPNGINTVYTDSLNGCNAADIVAKLKDGRNLVITSHHVPTNVDGQMRALEQQLKTYSPYIDTTSKGKAFLNIRGHERNGSLEPEKNPIVDKVVELMQKFFPKGSKVDITPYQNADRPAFFSSAHILQFDPNDLNKVKITNVGEKERFLDLRS